MTTRRSGSRRRERPAALPASTAKAPPEKAFWIHDGPVVHDLRELLEALRGAVSDEQFRHHVNAEKNDFALWIEQVLGDPATAAALRRVRTRLGAVRSLTARLRAAG